MKVSHLDKPFGVEVCKRAFDELPSPLCLLYTRNPKTLNPNPFFTSALYGWSHGLPARTRSQEKKSRKIPLPPCHPVPTSLFLLFSCPFPLASNNNLQIRNVKCMKCGAWGHQNTDRVCPRYGELLDTDEQQSGEVQRAAFQDPMELMRQMREVCARV